MKIQIAEWEIVVTNRFFKYKDKNDLLVRAVEQQNGTVKIWSNYIQGNVFTDFL